MADDDNHRVVEFLPDGTYVRQIGSYGVGDGQFRFPYDVGVDARQPRQLYVADNNNHRVQAFDFATLAFQRTWGQFGTEVGDFGYTRALAAVADDPAGGVAVADTANNRVQTFAPDGAPTAAWGIAGRGPGYVTRPEGVAIDAAGTVHVADTLDHRIERLGADGAYLGQTGYISANSGYASPAAGNGQFNTPGGVAVDRAAGRVWVADTANSRVQALGLDGTWQASATGFNAPREIAVAPDGAVYVADTGNGRVQRRDPAAARGRRSPRADFARRGRGHERRGLRRRHGRQPDPARRRGDAAPCPRRPAASTARPAWPPPAAPSTSPTRAPTASCASTRARAHGTSSEPGNGRRAVHRPARPGARHRARRRSSWRTRATTACSASR